MKRPFVGFALLIIAVVLLWQRQAEPNKNIVSQHFLALGTQFSISIVTGGNPERHQRALAAIEQSKRDLKAFNELWHPWNGSEQSLAAINRALSTQSKISVSPAHQELFDRAFLLKQQSMGRFDPTIGHLVKVWGFDDDQNFRSSPPNNSSIEQAISSPPLIWKKPTIGTAIDTGTSRQLDFGAIAKGYAVDQIIEALRNSGFKKALVNAGGDLRVSGQPEGRKWRIGIRDPRPELDLSGQQAPIAAIELEPGEAIFTSGDYERFFLFEGQRYHHILDPRSGQPSQGVQSLTVIADDATLADAAATALMVADADQWRRVARDLGVQYVLRIDDQGQWHTTDAMQARLILPPPEASAKSPTNPDQTNSAP